MSLSCHVAKAGIYHNPKKRDYKRYRARKERRAARVNPECIPYYKRFFGYF